jgi:two-component system LytT family response regulator
MQLRVAIVDDDTPGRAQLRRWLLREPNVELVAECSNGTEAIHAIHKKSPLLLFLGVRPPELDSFGVVDALGESSLPAVIFVTAHEQFAAQAFEKHAVDYLVKPFPRRRLQTAIKRARERLEWVSRRRANLAPPPGVPRRPRLSIRSNTCRSDPVGASMLSAALKWIGSALLIITPNCTSVTESHLLRSTLSSLAGRLAYHGFVRVSRGISLRWGGSKRFSPNRTVTYGCASEWDATDGSRNYRRNLAGLLRPSRTAANPRRGPKSSRSPASVLRSRF